MSQLYGKTSWEAESTLRVDVKSRGTDIQSQLLFIEVFSITFSLKDAILALLVLFFAESGSIGDLVIDLAAVSAMWFTNTMIDYKSNRE